MSLKHAIISEQGRRDQMEDTYYFYQTFDGSGQIFGGVYDGHCGSFASKYAALNLRRVFLGFIQSGLTPQEAFTLSYQKISAELVGQDSGACAVNFFIKGGKMFFANVGDARIIVIGKDHFRQLTTDHRVDNEIERKRIIANGGIIEGRHCYNGGRGLMPTRTLGDIYFKHIGIIATPDVGVYKISNQDIFLIAACDGLFDEMTNDEVASVARNFDDPKLLARELKKEVLDIRRGHDNLTIIVLSLTD